MGAVSGFATLVWPPTGIALAALLFFGDAVWPGIVIGATIANAWTGAPPIAALAIGLGNTLEAVVGAALLRRIPGFRLPLDRQRDVLGLVFFAAVGSTILSASVGVVTLLAAGRVVPLAVDETWGAWWLGDMSGDLVVAALLLTLPIAGLASPSGARRPWSLRWPSARTIAEAALLTAAIALPGWVIFGDWFGSAARPLRQAYMLWPVLIWAALRFGTAGAARATFLMTAIAITGTVSGHGPFIRDTLSSSLTALQVFVAVTAATFLVLGAAAAERKRVARERELLIGELEVAVGVRDDFLSVAAHELKTPLTPARLLTQGLVRAGARGDREAFDPQWLTPRLEAIERAVGRLESLIDQLLDVTRLAAGRLVLSREEMDLVQSVREVVAHHDGNAARAGRAITVHADAPVVGRWDRMRIEQLVGNLLSNALKYGAGHPVEVDVSGDERYARLLVRDHGIGVPGSEQDRIFEKFERATSVRHYGGFGLGLWIVREIVTAHGGRVRLESRSGEGSLFTVELPRTPQPQ